MQRRWELSRVQNELDTAYMEATSLITQLLLTAAQVKNGLDRPASMGELAHFERAIAKLKRAAEEAKTLIQA